MNGEELAGNRSSRSSWFWMFQTKTDKWLPNKAKNIRIDLWESKKKTCNCMHEAVQNILWESTLFWTTAKSSEIVKQLELNLLEANKLKKKFNIKTAHSKGLSFRKPFLKSLSFFFFPFSYNHKKPLKTASYVNERFKTFPSVFFRVFSKFGIYHLASFIPGLNPIKSSASTNFAIYGSCILK